MTHQEAIADGIVDRYVAGDLAPEEAAAFEEHFFECDECFAAAEASARLRQGIRHLAVAGELPVEVRVPIAATARSTVPRWIPYAAAAAIAGIAFWLPHSRVAILEQRLDETERRAVVLESELTRARTTPAPSVPVEPEAEANVPVAILQTTRSADAAIVLTIPAGATRFLLWIDGPAVPDKEIDVALLAADGATIARAPAVRPNRDGALVVAFATRLVRDGRYTVEQVIDGRVVARHQLAVTRPGQ